MGHIQTEVSCFEQALLCWRRRVYERYSLLAHIRHGRSMVLSHEQAVCQLRKKLVVSSIEGSKRAQALSPWSL
jgi:hypothetical protein